MSRYSFVATTPCVAVAAACIIFNATAIADMADSSNLPAIVVTAQHLDEGRSRIQINTGASTYTVDAAAIAATPGGDNTLLNQVILQARLTFKVLSLLVIRA